jgi:CheY-like chemotaxis protein
LRCGVSPVLTQSFINLSGLEGAMPSPAGVDSRPLALIVDDHADMREMYALHLSAQGISVVEAHDGAHALEKAQVFLPDVITIDLGLRDLSGATVCRRLKDHEATKGIPVIAVTGRAMPKDILSAFASGCVSVLIKPCLPETLLSEIRRVLAP